MAKLQLESVKNEYETSENLTAARLQNLIRTTEAAGPFIYLPAKSI